MDPELVITMVGSDAGGKRDKIIDWFKRTPGAVLISPLIQEGVSINEIEAGVVADYVADYEKADQIIRRFIRRKGGSNEVEIAWFIDRHQQRFEKGCLHVRGAGVYNRILLLTSRRSPVRHTRGSG